jgi:hypothetical protein
MKVNWVYTDGGIRVFKYGYITGSSVGRKRGEAQGRHLSSGPDKILL